MGERQSWYSIERNADASGAEIVLHNEIGGFGITSSEFVSALNEVENDGAPALKVRINSPGGSVDDGIAIFNALRAYKGDVTTVNDAMAGSIASVIFQAGTKRVMRPYSRVMIHNAMAMGGGLAVGYADDFEALATEAKRVATNLRETSATIAQIYADRSGKTAAFWQKQMDAEARFTGQKAVAEGLADEVSGSNSNVTALREAASFEFKGYREAALIREELLADLPDSETPAEQAPQLTFEAFKAGLEHLFEAHSACETAGCSHPTFAKTSPETAQAAQVVDPRAAARRELEEALARVQL